MATIRRTVHWTMLHEPGTARQLIEEATKQTDFSVTEASEHAIRIDVPRAILKDRWAATVEGTLSPNGRNTRVEWIVEGLGNRHHQHIAAIAENLPEGSLYDHGIPEAASRVPARVFGRKEIAHLVNVLDFDEHAHVIAVGTLGNKFGIVTLTDQRLLFLEKSLGSESLVQFDLSAIGALALGKRLGGETISVAHSGREVVIGQIGHGLGDAIVRKFRELKSGTGRSAPTSHTSDPLQQLEKLAELRDRGIVTAEEFEAKKQQLLGL